MKRYLFSLSLVFILALVISCQPAPSTEVPAAATTAPTPQPAAEATTPPPAEPTAAPTVEPTVPPTESAEVTVSAGPTLELIGPDGTKTLTLEELKQLPVVEGWAGIKSSTGKITPPVPFKGVALAELAQQVGGLSADLGLSIVAKDGYAMMFSYDQVTKGDFITYDPATGDEIKVDEPLQAVVAYEQNGQPIPADTDGPFRLVVLTPKNNQVVDGHWAIKWVTQVELKSMAEEWTLKASGALDEEIDRGTFESCTAPGCHQATWTDDKAQEWSGVPLWLLLGYVDDEIKHDDNAFAEALADQGYPVEVIAADGFSATFDSAQLKGNDNILVANQVNGTPLTDEYFPLRMVGSDVQKKEKVGQIARIVLHLPVQPAAAAATPEASPTAEPTEVPPTVEPTQAAAPAAAPAGEAALTITGAVAEEQALSLEALQALEVVEVTAEHPKKGPQTNEGVRLNALLEQAGVKAEATTLIVTAVDGYQVELNLADVQACADCLVAFNNGDALKLAMPGMDSNAWVKDVVKIEVK